jgi:AcrR family transcriptional regulator
VNERPATSERLLSAAIELLDQGGEAAVRIDAVAEAAGVKRPSIYYFFGDREGLIVAAQTERYRRTLLFGMRDQYKAVRALETHEQFIEFVSAWMAAISTPDGEHRRSVRMQVLGSAASRPELRDAVEAADSEASEQFAMVIAVAQDRGWTGRRFDPEVAALWWFGMVNGRFLVEGSRSAADRQAWDEIATEAIVRLFGPPAAT